MPKRADRKPRDIACAEKHSRLRLLRLEPKSSVLGVRKPANAIWDGLDLRTDRAINAQSLRELEAENAELRNTAIQLALEIQDLRMAGDRPPQARSVGSC
jgi:hypothetical protein